MDKLKLLYYNLQYIKHKSINQTTFYFTRKVGDSIFPVLFLLSIAVANDIFTYKVKNIWIIFLFGISCILRFRTEGISGVGIGLLQMLFVLTCLLPVFAVRALGAADIKIFLALSVFFPLKAILFIICASLIIGAFGGLMKMFIFRGSHLIHFTIPIFISVLLYVYGGVYELFFSSL